MAILNHFIQFYPIFYGNKYNGIFVPLRGKECSTQQMPFIADKVPTFSQFANSSLEDIYGPNIHNSYQREATQFKSIVLINNGNGKFEKIVLPNMAQMMPILDADTTDFNDDGYEDIIVVGNLYNTEVETPRLDNPFGLVLLSNGKNGYIVEGPEKTGFYINGNAKSVKIIEGDNNSKLIFVGINNSRVETFEFNPNR